MKIHFFQAKKGRRNGLKSPALWICTNPCGRWLASDGGLTDRPRRFNRQQASAYKSD
jgi:hypothetical protein